MSARFVLPGRASLATAKQGACLHHQNIQAYPKQDYSRKRQVAICKAAETEATLSQTETYDVYVSSPKKLAEGVEKHVISVFVADESGIINRVAGVFARRSVNIESLAVGLNIDKALFTIVVNDEPSTIATLVKHLSKLVKVRYVEDVTASQRLDRELALIKLGLGHGAQRAEALELAKIFKAKVVDVGPEAITIALSGDPGKLFAFENATRAFNMVELSRTGRISLRKSDIGLDMGGTTYGPASEHSRERDAAAVAKREAADMAPQGADVYIAGNSSQGVWNVRNIMDPVYDESTTAFRPFTLSIEVNNVPGVLNEVTGVLARRGYNVQSLAVGTSETKGRSRIITVVPGLNGSIGNLVKQLQRLVVVHTVTDLTNVPSVSRELALVKVRCTQSQRSEVKCIADIFEAEIALLTRQTMTIEVIGSEEKMRSIQDVLEPYGILEFARTGRVAMRRASKVDSRLLQSSDLGIV